MTTSETGKSVVHRGQRGFTLVELLAVVAIMAIVMSILGYSINNMGGSSVQVAAAQVASGLSLARQYAVAKNLETRFVIGNLADATGAGLPPESWRHWTVIQTNRDSGTWTMLKEWEKLPGGVVFLNLAQGDYSVINGDPLTGATPGAPFKPVFQTTAFGGGSEWKGFSSYADFKVVAGTNSSAGMTLSNAPAIGYRGVGEAIRGDGKSFGSGGGGNVQEAAIRVAAGGVTPNNEIILRATNNYYYIETDKRGRVRVRSPETFRN